MSALRLSFPPEDLNGDQPLFMLRVYNRKRFNYEKISKSKIITKQEISMLYTIYYILCKDLYHILCRRSIFKNK